MKRNNTAYIYIFVVTILVLIFFLFLNRSGSEDNSNSGDYTAVFLENGQVYFGKIKKENPAQIVLTDIYYLQFAGTDTATDTQVLSSSDNEFNLIKRGNELHGPSDEMRINMDFVLFTEKLSEDSQVLKTISTNAPN